MIIFNGAYFTSTLKCTEMKDEKETTEEKEGLTPLEIKFITSFLKCYGDWSKSSSSNTGEISFLAAKAAARVCEEEMVRFAEWFEKLTPEQKCSVWSPNGLSNGLFKKPYKDLVTDYLKQKSNALIYPSQISNGI